MIDKNYITKLIKNILEDNDLYSDDALYLLLGTMAVESDFGEHIKQIDGGALGFFQNEKPTFEDLQNRFGGKFPYLAACEFEDLETNLYLQILTARVKYWSIPEPLPDHKNIWAMA